MLGITVYVEYNDGKRQTFAASLVALEQPDFQWLLDLGVNGGIKNIMIEKLPVGSNVSGPRVTTNLAWHCSVCGIVPVNKCPNCGLNEDDADNTKGVECDKSIPDKKAEMLL